MAGRDIVRLRPVVILMLAKNRYVPSYSTYLLKIFIARFVDIP